jgi:hypothetical protein
VKPASTEEDFIAGVLADALRGELQVGLADAARIAMSAQRIEPRRIAPLALAKWMAADPRAREVMRWALQQTVRQRG